MLFGLIVLIPMKAMESPLVVEINIAKTVRHAAKVNLEAKKVLDWGYHFNNTVAFIKKHEGWSNTPYLDICGYETIGYGFITKYVKLKYRKRISKRDAHYIVIEKLQANLRYARKTYPRLNYMQSLAVAHLAYGKGFGKIKKHALHEQLLKGIVNRDTWLYFSSYERTRANYRRSREYELNLFYI